MDHDAADFDMEDKLALPEGDENSKKFVGLLSNYEVFSFFKDVKDCNSRGSKHANKWKYNTHLNTVTYEVLQYLQQTPCAHQSAEIVEDFLTKLHPYKLTKAELLAMLNTRPTQPVDIQAIVEESEERLTEAQIDEILNIVEQSLPVPEATNEEDKAGSQE